MGSRFSKLSRTTQYIKNFMRRVAIRNTARRNMIAYALELIEKLNLGPSLKVRIKRRKNEAGENHENEVGSDDGEAASNLDLLSGVGTAGTIEDFGFATDFDSEDDSDLENPPTQAIPNTVQIPTAVQTQSDPETAIHRLSKKVSVKAAGQLLLGKFKQQLSSQFKTIDVFFYDTGKGGVGSKMSARQMFLKALDCHDAVVELNAQLDYLAEKFQKHQTQQQSSKMKKMSIERNSLKISSKKGQKFHTPDKLIAEGTCFRGTIKVPANLENNGNIATNDENEENASVGTLPIEHRYSNLYPEFTNLDPDALRPYDLQIERPILPLNFSINNGFSNNTIGNNSMNSNGFNLLNANLQNGFWIGKHLTYEGKRDQQTIILSLDSEDNIYYEDYETHCAGLLDKDKYTILGSVRQLKQGQPGFFEPSNIAHHTFTVTRLSDSNSTELNELRSKLFKARSARALAFAVWCGSGISGSRISQERFANRHVDWAELIEDMVWLLDEVSATIRLYVLILDEVQFYNLKHRKALLEHLKGKGLGRAEVHSLWDAANLLTNAIKENIPVGSVHESTRMRFVNNFYEKVNGRMNHVYNRFDASLKRAEKRICISVLKNFEVIFEPKVLKRLDSMSLSSMASKSYEKNKRLKNRSAKGKSKNKKMKKASSKRNVLKVDKPKLLVTDLSKEKELQKKKLLKITSEHSLFNFTAKSSERDLTTSSETSEENINLEATEVTESSSKNSDENAQCVICTNGYESNTKIFVTPCKHAFHIECLKDWFRESSECPICRRDFSELDN